MRRKDLLSKSKLQVFHATFELFPFPCVHSDDWPWCRLVWYISFLFFFIKGCWDFSLSETHPPACVMIGTSKHCKTFCFKPNGQITKLTYFVLWYYLFKQVCWISGLINLLTHATENSVSCLMWWSSTEFDHTKHFMYYFKSCILRWGRVGK